MTRYAALQARLEEDLDREVVLSFDEIDDLVGSLPASARNHRAWWANSRSGHSHAAAWLETGRQVTDVNLTRGLVCFSPGSQAVPFAVGDAAVAATRRPRPAAEPAGPAPDWPEVWRAVAARLQRHVNAGLQHLLTEDVIRFATIRALTDLGTDPSRVAVEHRVRDIAASIDLVIDRPPTAVVELKYPRDPEGAGAADTMTLGELIRDLYRLGWMADAEAWALQVLEPRLRGFLSRRRELRWTWTPGESIVVPATLGPTLPASAQRSLPPWTQALTVEAACTFAQQAGDLVIAAYRVRSLPGARTGAPD